MGSEPSVNYQAPPASESTAAQLEAMTTGLPGLMNALSAEYLPSERAKLEASQAVSPEYAKLAEQIYATTGMRLNEIGNAINDINAKAQAETSADVVAGPGRRLVEEGLKTARIADPEYYRTRELAGARLAEMLNGGITPGEEEAISRGVAKDRIGSGNLNAPSNIEGIKAGILYGNAATQKMSNALQLATGAMPTMKSGVNPFQTYPTAAPNTGDTRATGAMTGLGQTVDTQGGNLLNQAGENQRAMIQSKTSLDTARMAGYRSAWQDLGSVMPGIGFNFGK